MAVTPQPFSLHVPQADIDDLRRRLAKTRYPDQAPDALWAFGTDVDYLRGLVDYWRTTFDWRAQEAWLNAFPQFKVPLHGIDLHYLDVQGKGPAPKPLLLLHGWPGSVYEFLDIIPRLADPERFGGHAEDAFTLIVPSLPGYGLSFQPNQSRFSAAEMGDCFADLMTEVLGLRKFGVQGGDWGAFIASSMGVRHADKVVGIHVNALAIRPDATLPENPTPEERRYSEEVAQFLKEETGYQWIQGTKPQTLAFGLTDSPAGLAAWIVEKFRTWSDCGGALESAFSRDHLLANIALYWFSGAIGSSFWPPTWAMADSRWPYGGCADGPRRLSARNSASAAFACREDLYQHPALDGMPKGGHFAAMEQPELLAHDVAKFFRPLRTVF
jgi:pimeloyl-ACP methyl ester carboxylesterase